MLKILGNQVYTNPPIDPKTSGIMVSPEDGEKIKEWDIIGMEVNIVL